MKSDWIKNRRPHCMREYVYGERITNVLQLRSWSYLLVILNYDLIPLTIAFVTFINILCAKLIYLNSRVSFIPTDSPPSSIIHIGWATNPNTSSNLKLPFMVFPLWILCYFALTPINHNCTFSLLKIHSVLHIQILIILNGLYTATTSINNRNIVALNAIDQYHFLCSLNAPSMLIWLIM